MDTDPLRAEVAQRFRDAIASLRISKSRAARDLQVSRQMLYQYLAGKSLPKHTVLQRACSAWKLELNYKDLLVSAKSFPERNMITNAPTPVQLDLDLQEAIEQLRNEDVQVRILRKMNGRIELEVDLSFGSAS